MRRIIQQQRKITEASKKLEMKKLYQVLIICDDLADVPQLHKPRWTLFIQGRRMQISAWVSSEKLRLISAAVRVNQQFLCCWRLRNHHEGPAVPVVRAGDPAPEAEERNVLRSVSRLRKTAMGAALSASWARSCSPAPR